MKIVIAGAGDVGFHLAELLALENQDIVLIDTNQEVLDYANSHLDVLTIKGDSTTFEILEQAGISKAKLVLAVTTSEKTNILTAILAKKMGAKQTIARVRHQSYFGPEQKKTYHELGVDTLISPQQLAAREIQRLVQQSELTDIFEFEDGKVDVIGFTLSGQSPLVNSTIKEVDERYPNIVFQLIAILRGHNTIVPRGDTILRRNDHIYFITKKEKIDEVKKMVGGSSIVLKKETKKIMIIGGTGIAYETALLLENDYNVTLVAKEKSVCKKFAERLNKALVIHGEPSNVDLLREEGLKETDAFIALTPNSETNIITSLTAKNNGVANTIALVENATYTHISQDIGVNTLINKKLIAANNIFRFVRKGNIKAIGSLHGVNAELIEFVISKNNRMTKHPLRELHFPKQALVGGVIRGEETLLPDGDFQFQLDDKVIVFALPEAISKVEQLFR